MAESIVVNKSNQLGATCRGFMIGFPLGVLVGIFGVAIFLGQF